MDVATDYMSRKNIIASEGENTQNLLDLVLNFYLSSYHWQYWEQKQFSHLANAYYMAGTYAKFIYALLYLIFQQLYKSDFFKLISILEEKLELRDVRSLFHNHTDC